MKRGRHQRAMRESVKQDDDKLFAKCIEEFEKALNIKKVRK